MGKLTGIAVILSVLVGVLILTAENFASERNALNLTRQIGFLGIYSMGAGIVIVTGGIDLSVGSLIGLVGILLSLALRQWEIGVAGGVAFCLAVSGGLGWVHGFLITKVRLQPFVVTLCALLIYRGAARYIAEDATQGFGTDFPVFKQLANGSLWGIPFPMWIMLFLAAVLTLLVHRTVFGRHLFAVGGNEQAAHFSGVPVAGVKKAAYLLAGLLTGIAGILVALYANAVQPANHGSFFELYAIASAVLGGCSLRGGEGTIPGVILGSALISTLWNGINLWGIPSYLEYTVIGGVILIGAITDELVRGRLRKRP
jgi:ribose transport system permease protein